LIESTILAHLETYHTFCFSTYWDKAFEKFHSLLVLNEDVVEANQGFDFHPHENTELLTVVVSGELVHKDTMANVIRIGPNEVQLTSAGKGIRHAEMNPSKTNKTHVLQIWEQFDYRNPVRLFIIQL